MTAATPAATMTTLSHVETTQNAAYDRFDRLGRLGANIFMAALAVMFVYAYLGHFVTG